MTSAKHRVHATEWPEPWWAEGDFLLHQTEDGQTSIQRRLEEEPLWLSQAQMAELFQANPQNITPHPGLIHDEHELSEAATRKDSFLTYEVGESLSFRACVRARGRELQRCRAVAASR